MNDQRFSAWIALIVVGGTLVMFGVLAFLPIPEANEKTLDMIVTAWLTVGLAVVLKRLFDGNAANDQKNDTISAQATALAAQAPPTTTTTTTEPAATAPAGPKK